MKSCENQKRSSGCAQVVRRKALLQKHLYWQCTFLFFTSIVTYVKSGACFGITWVICRLRLDVKLLFRDIPLYSWTRFCVSRLLTPLSASCSNMYFKLLTYTNITSFSFFSSIFSFVYFPLCSPFSLMICTSLYVCIEWSHSTRLRLAQWPHLDCAGPLRGWRWQGRQGQCKIDWREDMRIFIGCEIINREMSILMTNSVFLSCLSLKYLNHVVHVDLKLVSESHTSRSRFAFDWVSIF